jgi:hypothetical protein
MAERSEIGVSADAPFQAELKIVARAFGRARRVEVAVNGAAAALLTITPERGEHVTRPFDVSAGLNAITFVSLDGADAAPGGDPRRLSIAVFRIELLRAR